VREKPRSFIGNWRSEHDPYKEEQALWDAYREIRQARGINIDQFFAEWAAKQAQGLPSPGARQDFDELCKHGCNPQVLVAIVAGLRNSPRLEAIWAMMVGPTEDRQKTIQTLEKAAATLEEIFGAFIAVEDEKVREEFAKIGRIAPSRMVSVRRHLDQIYVDKLDGRIAEDFWKGKTTEWRDEEQCLLTSIGELNEAKPERLLDAVRILELANKAHFLYHSQNSAEKAKLLRIVLSNCTINATNVYPTYRKPFDLIFQAAQTERWWAWGESNSRPML
jgi:hypothetical protein